MPLIINNNIYQYYTQIKLLNGGDNLKRIVPILILSIMLSIVAISGCTDSASSKNSNSYSTSSGTQGTWHSVANFTGSADKTTAPFTIKGSKFKLNYSISRERTDFGFFYVNVYPEGDTASYVASADLSDRSKLTEQDETYVYEGSGTYYCKIGASNMKKWKVEVFDYY